MAGTDAVHNEDPMTPEAAQELSQQILGDMGIGTDQAEGADHTGEQPGDANPGTPEGPELGAPSNPEPRVEQGADPVEQPGADKTAGWMNALPEEVQADLSRMNPATVAALRDMAEGGMRMDDYTRKTQATARERADLQRRAELAEAMVERALSGQAPGPQAPEQPDDGIPSVKELMAEPDPDKFEAGLDAILEAKINRANKQARSQSPEHKQNVVRQAAVQIHDAISDRLPEGTWDRAEVLFAEHCQQKGINWWDVPANELAMEMRPHIRFALAEHAAKGQTQQPTQPQQGNDGKSRPEQQPGVGAAVMPSSGPNIPTHRVEPHVREGREISEEEAYTKVMTKFGIANEEELARLRRMGD